MPPNADEDCILEKQKNDACERSRLFRARIASREIVFRVNPCETCEKHFEECVSIGFDAIIADTRSNNYTHFFQEQNSRVAFQSVSRCEAKRKRKEKRTLPVACIDWDMI